MNKSTIQDNEHVYNVHRLVEKFDEKGKKIRGDYISASSEHHIQWC
jgi:hypothetical protein